MYRFCLPPRIIASCLALTLCFGQFLTKQSDAQDRGLDGNFGHTALSTVGRDTGITYLELFPYVQNGDSQILFGDIRGFVTNDGEVGANLTTGFRFLEPNKLFVLGINTHTISIKLQEKHFNNLDLAWKHNLALEV